MINIKEIIANPEKLKQSLIKRNLDFAIITTLTELYQQVKKLITSTEQVKAKLNNLATEIGKNIKNKLPIEELKVQVAETKKLENKLQSELTSKQEQLKNELLYIPNIVDPTVPSGKDENDNIIVKTYLKPTEFDFTPKPHYELGDNLQMLDFKTAAVLSGSRFSILRKQLAQLERALTNFMLDCHTNHHGFTEYNVPVVVNEQTLVGTAQLPKFAEDMFQTNLDNKWLISTGEIYLTNLFRNHILNEEELPIRVTAATQCFRKEAGSRGKDTKGMIRQHQFTKVEMVSISHPKHSHNELEYLTRCAENILQQLELPYRVVLLCGGDIGFASSKTYDLEVWLPSEQRYREISSCSLCTDFQAIRLNTKVKTTNGNSWVHTLNGSGLAIGRTLVAILENYQQADGSIKIPQVLIPYMNGTMVIKN